MDINFDKTDFSNREIIEFNNKIQYKIKADYIPIIIKIDSKILSINDFKYFIIKYKHLNDFENILRGRIRNLNPIDILEFRINDLIIDKETTFETIYRNYKHYKLNCVFISINRITLTRYLKSLFY